MCSSLGKEWRDLCLAPDMSIKDALRCIDKAAKQFALAVDGDGVLVGVLTDGNIRRALISGSTLESPVARIMTADPARVDATVTAEQAMRLMTEKDVSHLPVVDGGGRVIGLWSRKDLQSTKELPNSVVLMAGGLGTRLGSLTETCPKPMLRVGEQPLLEIILRQYVRTGFRRFYMAVNYLADSIVEHFGDGSAFGCRIEYLRENKRMGTAGALSLLPAQELPFLVANGDVLTHMNMRWLLFDHVVRGAAATMVVKRHSFTVPYGVVDADAGGVITGIREKPEYNFCVNAGMYAISPDILPLIPADTFFDMPDLFKALVAGGRQPFIYQTEDYWLDIGHIGDYERAQRDMVE